MCNLALKFRMINALHGKKKKIINKKSNEKHIFKANFQLPLPEKCMHALMN